MSEKLMEFWEWFWRRFDDPVVQGFAFALMGVPLYFAFDLPRVTFDDQGNISNFIEWFGVPYGLILALVLVNVWTQFEMTDRAFDREADTLLTLHNSFLLSTNYDVVSKVEEKLKEYVDLLISFYFSSQTIQNKENKKLQETAEINLLQAIRSNIQGLLNTKQDHDLAIELLRLTNELVDNRGDRGSLVYQRLPDPVRYLSVVASFTWLIPFYSLKFANPLVGAFFIVVVTMVVVAILLIIFDLDNPIGGFWGVQSTSWDNVKHEIAMEIAARRKDPMENFNL